MATEIWRDFDPNLDIPIGLKNARVTEKTDIPETYDGEFVESDDDSDLGEDGDDETLAVPDGFVILSQTVRTAPDGSQVVDVVIEVDEVDGALNYQFRMTKA